jgi:pyruvate kinase
VGILQDLQGPKIRLGRFEKGSIQLEKGGRISLTSAEILGDLHHQLPSPTTLADEVPPGSTILLDDGRVEMRVESVDLEHQRTPLRSGGGRHVLQQQGGEFPGGLSLH